jgi:phosphotransferase system HPr-like phosphotransfer protein
VNTIAMDPNGWHARNQSLLVTVLSTFNTEAHQEKENLPPAQGKSNLATCSFPDTCLKLPEESFNLRAQN